MQRNRARFSEVERQLRTALEGILTEKTISVNVGHGRFVDVIRADSGAMIYARAVFGPSSPPKPSIQTTTEERNEE